MHVSKWSCRVIGLADALYIALASLIVFWRQMISEPVYIYSCYTPPTYKQLQWQWTVKGELFGELICSGHIHRIHHIYPCSTLIKVVGLGCCMLIPVALAPDRMKTPPFFTPFQRLLCTMYSCVVANSVHFLFYIIALAKLCCVCICIDNLIIIVYYSVEYTSGKDHSKMMRM